MSERRLRRILISPEALIEMCTTKRMTLDVEGLPSGSKYYGAAFDIPTGQLAIFAEHESFDNVKVGDRIPEHVPRFTMHMKKIETEYGPQG